MKRVIRIIALVMLFVLSPGCMAEESGAYYWYELNGDVLTVRLPASADGEWKFSVSDPDLLELITCEFVEGESQFAASFRNFSEKKGEVALQLHNAASGTRCGVLVNALKGSGIEVDGSYMASGNMLTVRMAAGTAADGKWSTKLTGCPSMMLSEGTRETGENAGDATYTAAFMLMGNPAGSALKISYTRAGKIRAEKQYKLKF